MLWWWWRRLLLQVLGDNAAEAETLFKGEPETALIAAILWAFEVCYPPLCLCFWAGLVLFCSSHRCTIFRLVAGRLLREAVILILYTRYLVPGIYGSGKCFYSLCGLDRGHFFPCRSGRCISPKAHPAWETLRSSDS